MAGTGRMRSRISPLNPKSEIMKITRKTRNGESRETLLKEYFITASLIALLKRVGEEAAKAVPARVAIPVQARARH